MSLTLERGLFLLDFTDHHAILGVPVDAEIKDIRKKYLKIARRLHPDSLASEGEVERKNASQFLSKLVNPAWEKLSQEKDRSEYLLLLKLKGQQALQKRGTFEVYSSLAKELSSSNNPDHFYLTSLKDLGSKQYDDLEHTLELTEQISELNLVYLMRKESSGSKAVDEPKKRIYTGSNIPDSTQAANKTQAQTVSSTPQRESFTDQYYRRAEALIAKGNFAQAILELRDALKIEPNNSQCHALLGFIHIKQKQLPMARVHVNKALQIDPQNEMALKIKKSLEKKDDNGPDDKPGGGLFGLFGGKKKK